MKPTSTLKIGLDFDGVISDCSQLKVQAAKQLYNLTIPAQDFKKELLISKGLLAAEQYRHLQIQIYETRPLGFQMTPVPEVLDYLQKLTTHHYVEIVTSRWGESSLIAQEWLHQQSPNLNIKITGIDYGQTKAQALQGFDIFVDDDLDKLEPLVNIVPHRFLFSWGYNHHLTAGSVAQRVNSWPDLYQQIEKIAASSN